MVFSSVTFLFLFLPIVLVGTFALPKSWRNAWLLAASLFFYAWGETGYVLLMLLSISTNFLLGLWVEAARKGGSGNSAVAVAVGLNLLLLGIFKYATLLVEAISPLLASVGLPALSIEPIHLPIGISFFTFQAISYIVDVHRGEVPAQRRPVHLALYIALFPQLIAGPIVRYSHIAAQLASRRVDLDGFAQGVQRFVLGLGKKVLLANTFAAPADAIFALEASDLSPGVAWLGVLCYTLQIYFDFSGYSDMAIGLGRMFGFHFLENFNYPYIARSIREFWRRWHLSLSTWFRDYLYIPLGGSRGGPVRTYGNLVTVFFLCGLWHGASWTFAVWGLYHGLFLVLERLGLGARIERLPGPLQHLYALVVVMVGWVFFRAETFSGAFAMLASMAGLARGDDLAHEVSRYLDPLLVSAMLFALVAATPVAGWLAENLRRRGVSPAGRAALAAVSCLLVLGTSVLALTAQTHDPFIYFRF